MKPFKSYRQQAELLISRGLTNVPSIAHLEKRLQAIGYYRLSGYLYSYREKTRDKDGQWITLNQFRKGTDFQVVWERYLFDRRLRFLIMDAIERVEIAFRVAIAYEWAQYAGVSNPQQHLFSYALKYQKLSSEKRLEAFQKNYWSSREDCAYHFREVKKIESVGELPIWVMVQFSTFGNLHHLYEGGIPLEVKKKIAATFGFEDEGFFASIMALLNQARNTCAHHGRIWNKKWKRRAGGSRVVDIVQDCNLAPWNLLPKDSTAFLLLSLHILLEKTAESSHWNERLSTLLKENPPVLSIDREMGFPKSWRHLPIWSGLNPQH